MIVKREFTIVVHGRFPNISSPKEPFQLTNVTHSFQQLNEKSVPPSGTFSSFYVTR